MNNVHGVGCIEHAMLAQQLGAAFALEGRKQDFIRPVMSKDEVYSTVAQVTDSVENHNGTHGYGSKSLTRITKYSAS